MGFPSDGGGFIFKRGGGAPLGGIGFDEGFLKKIVGWGRGGGGGGHAPQLWMENPDIRFNECQKFP